MDKNIKLFEQLPKNIAQDVKKTQQNSTEKLQNNADEESIHTVVKNNEPLNNDDLIDLKEIDTIDEEDFKDLSNPDSLSLKDDNDELDKKIDEEVDKVTQQEVLEEPKEESEEVLEEPKEESEEVLEEPKEESEEVFEEPVIELETPEEQVSAQEYTKEMKASIENEFEKLKKDSNVSSSSLDEAQKGKMSTLFKEINNEARATIQELKQDAQFLKDVDNSFAIKEALDRLRDRHNKKIVQAISQMKNETKKVSKEENNQNAVYNGDNGLEGLKKQDNDSIKASAKNDEKIDTKTKVKYNDVNPEYFEAIENHKKASENFMSEWKKKNPKPEASSKDELNAWNKKASEQRKEFEKEYAKNNSLFAKYCKKMFNDTVKKEFDTMLEKRYLQDSDSSVSLVSLEKIAKEYKEKYPEYSDLIDDYLKEI